MKTALNQLCVEKEGETEEKERIRGGLWGAVVGNKGKIEDGGVGGCE